MKSSSTTDQQTVVRMFGKRKIVFDREGFFTDFSDWTRAICIVLTGECGLTGLSENHWRVIHFLRAFYSNNGRAPLNNQLKNGTSMTLLELETIFPGGIKNGARRLAGLPNPNTCD